MVIASRRPTSLRLMGCLRRVSAKRRSSSSLRCDQEEHLALQAAAFQLIDQLRHAGHLGRGIACVEPDGGAVRRWFRACAPCRKRTASAAPPGYCRCSRETEVLEHVQGTLLPEPDSPLRMMMRTSQWLSTGTAAASPAAAQQARLHTRSARRPSAAWWSVRFSLCFLMQRSSLSASRSMAAYMSSSVASAWMALAAHVQRGFGLLSQLLYRQHTVHVDDLIKVSADALELLLDITPQRRGDFGRDVR